MKQRITIAVVALLLVGACGATRQEILGRTLAGLDAAHVAFVDGDARRQAIIVADAKSLEDGKAALADYRVKRDRVAVAFVAAYGAAAVASLNLTDAAILQVVTLATAVIDALRELGIIGGTS